MWANPTGKEEDVEVGLVYFGKRYLNTALQRWVSADPLEIHSPGKADANLYAYVRGMALSNVDPLGLDDCSVSSCVADDGQSEMVSSDAATETLDDPSEMVCGGGNMCHAEAAEPKAAESTDPKGDPLLQNPVQGVAAATVSELAEATQGLIVTFSIPVDVETPDGPAIQLPDGSVDAIDWLQQFKTDTPAEGEASFATRLSFSATKSAIRLLTLGFSAKTPGGAVLAESKGAVIEAGRAAAGSATSNTTRFGVKRTNAADWRQLRDTWDKGGMGDILSAANRQAIAKGRTPVVDDAWIQYFPGDKALRGEKIPMHHIGGSPIAVPLPASRHMDAHMPGGFRRNPGGPGTSG